MTEFITISDHVRFAPFTHAALGKGDPVVLASGALVGFADHAFEADEAVVLDIGVARSVFRVDAADVTGTPAPAVGSAVYITGAGALTMTASGNTLIGVITDTDGAVSFVKLG
jgi:hypothetical protein